MRDDAVLLRDYPDRSLLCIDAAVREKGKETKGFYEKKKSGGIRHCGRTVPGSVRLPEDSSDRAGGSDLRGTDKTV